MTRQRHPLLERAGIDDCGLEIEFEECGMIAAPDLTFQYSKKGDLNTTSFYTYTPLCEDAPALYRRQFIDKWMVSGRCNNLPDLDGQTCYKRLQALITRSLKQLPDNPCVQQEAWLAGVTAEMPAAYAAAIQRLHERIAAYIADLRRKAEVTDGAAQTGARQVLRSWVTDRCCNGNPNECSCDQATEYALPDGSTSVHYVCCQ